MKCPICGCKMKDEIMCPYCHITGDQVKNASNKEAKRRIKERNTKEVYESNYTPIDINNTRLSLMVLFGGLFGVHRIYLGKYKSGFIFPIVLLLTIISHVLKTNFITNSITMNYVADFFYLAEGLLILQWISDFIRILLRNFPIPVVLGEKNNDIRGKKKWKQLL